MLLSAAAHVGVVAGRASAAGNAGAAGHASAAGHDGAAATPALTNGVAVQFKAVPKHVKRVTAWSPCLGCRSTMSADEAL